MYVHVCTPVCTLCVCMWPQVKLTAKGKESDSLALKVGVVYLKFLVPMVSAYNKSYLLILIEELLS